MQYDSTKKLQALGPPARSVEHNYLAMTEVTESFIGDFVHLDIRSFQDFRGRTH